MHVTNEMMVGKKVAVDMNIYLCRIFYAQASIVNPEMLAMAYLMFHDDLVAKGLDPVHVYDGPPSRIKRFAHEKRA